jgi:AraC-like DNA-binding protein
MLSDALVDPRTETTAPPPYLLDLIGRAKRAIEDDPALSRRYLDEVRDLLSGGRTDPMDRILLPSAVPHSGAGPAKGGLAAWQLRRVRDHVERHLDGPILVEDLAAVAKLSSGHFCRAFKASTRDTPHGYIVRQRIRRAQTLMLSTRDSLSQIACACGLTDQAHLTRLFRRLVDDTPLAWRRTWQTA